MESCRNIRSEDTTLQALHMPTNIGLALKHSSIVYFLLFRFMLVGAYDVSLESLQKDTHTIKISQMLKDARTYSIAFLIQIEMYRRTLT